MSTKQKILQHALEIFAKEGYDGVSMRVLAEEVGIAPSVVYHHFADKNALLLEMFTSINTSLGLARAKLPDTATASEMLKQRIIFQLDHAEEIVAVLKYFLAYRKHFPHLSTGFVPEKAYLHIQEVLQRGRETGEFVVSDMEADAKVITHAINGFLLEYYPHKPKGEEKKRLVTSIHQFLLRALKKGGEDT